MSGPGTQALLTLIDRDWDTFVESAAHAWLGWPDPELGRQSAEWFRTATTPAIAKATMREASAIDVRPELPSVRCPVLVLHRTDATVIPLAMSQALAASLPDARLELLPGTTASLFFEDPEGVADRIATFASAPTTAAPDTAASPLRPPARAGGPASATAPGTLSPREAEVLRAVAQGRRERFEISNGMTVASARCSTRTGQRTSGSSGRVDRARLAHRRLGDRRRRRGAEPLGGLAAELQSGQPSHAMRGRLDERVPIALDQRQERLRARAAHGIPAACEAAEQDEARGPRLVARPRDASITE